MKTHFKFILCFVGILSITACGSSDPDLPGSGGTGGDDETLVTLAGDRSFSLLSLSAGKGLASGTYNIQPLAAFIQENIIRIKMWISGLPAREKRIWLARSLTVVARTVNAGRGYSLLPVGKMAEKQEWLCLSGNVFMVRIK
jgi:hypothetical protein